MRHNEDKLNATLKDQVELAPYNNCLDSPHIKTFLLLQAHFGQVKMPIADYSTDLKTVLDSTIRIIQAYVDIAADKGYLSAVLNLMQLLQMIMQGRWHHESSLKVLPGLRDTNIELLAKRGIDCIPQFLALSDKEATGALAKAHVASNAITRMIDVKNRLPVLDMRINEMEYNEEEGTITVKMHIDRLSKHTGQAYTPNYTKFKDEGYWVVIGDLSVGTVLSDGTRSGELLALKRVTIDRALKTELVIPLAKDRKLTLFLMSDAYIGLDMQTDFAT